MNLIRTVSMTTSSAVLTGMSRVTDLSTGLYVFGIGVPVGAQIQSIDSTHTTVTLTSAATLTQTVAVEFTTASRDVYLERQNALKDVWNVMQERGDLVEIENRKEGDIVRDTYSSIEKRNLVTSLKFRAFPVEFQPSQKKLEKAGIKEQCDVLVYTSMLDWINAGVDFNDIEIATRNTVHVQGNTYEVKEKGLYGQFNDTFLYITLALNKK